jgi:hypothetical protein
MAELWFPLIDIPDRLKLGAYGTSRVTPRVHLRKYRNSIPSVPKFDYRHFGSRSSAEKLKYDHAVSVDETQPATTPQPATAQALTERSQGQSHSLSSREYTPIPKSPLPRLAPPQAAPTWRSLVSETRVYGKADLRDIPALSESLQVFRI